MALGRYLRRCGALWESESFDWDIIQGRGAEYLGTVRTETHGPGYVTLYVPPDAASAGIETALVAVERGCMPLPDREIKKGIGSLFALCKTRAMDEDEITLSMELYTERLRDYPADAVVYAIKHWPEHNTFFPSWQELKRMVLTHCWRRMQLRDRLREILRKRRENGPSVSISQAK